CSVAEQIGFDGASADPTRMRQLAASLNCSDVQAGSGDPQPGKVTQRAFWSGAGNSLNRQQPLGSEGITTRAAPRTGQHPHDPRTILGDFRSVGSLSHPATSSAGNRASGDRKPDLRAASRMACRHHSTGVVQRSAAAVATTCASQAGICTVRLFGYIFWRLIVFTSFSIIDSAYLSLIKCRNNSFLLVHYLP